MFTAYFPKMNEKTFTGFLLIILIILISMLFFFPNSDNYFYQNIIPELIGVCLELLVILLLFNQWQEKKKRNKLIVLEKRLREYLIFFLKHNFQSLPQKIRIGKFHGEKHEENVKSLQAMITYIKEHDLSSKNIFSIQAHCLLEASTLGDLLPVASELTDDHFKAWCRIVYFTDKIGISNDPNDIKSLTIDILNNIKRFDSASYNHNLYVGANTSIN